jgi:hypothetical protein
MFFQSGKQFAVRPASEQSRMGGRPDAGISAAGCNIEYIPILVLASLTVKILRLVPGIEKATGADPVAFVFDPEAEAVQRRLRRCWPRPIFLAS